jgi:hypothetical protein
MQGITDLTEELNPDKQPFVIEIHNEIGNKAVLSGAYDNPDYWTDSYSEGEGDGDSDSNCSYINKAIPVIGMSLVPSESVEYSHKYEINLRKNTKTPDRQLYVRILDSSDFTKELVPECKIDELITAMEDNIAICVERAKMTSVTCTTQIIGMPIEVIRETSKFRSSVKIMF